MTKPVFALGLLICLIGSLFAVVSATLPSKEERKSILDGWQAAIGYLRRQYPKFFEEPSADEMLTNIDNNVARIRDGELEVEPENWEALKNFTASWNHSSRSGPPSSPLDSDSESSFTSNFAYKETLANQQQNNAASSSVKNMEIDPSAVTDDDDEEVTPQHLIKPVQGLESNRGAGSAEVPSQMWCRSVLRDDYMVYPQKLIIDTSKSTGVRFQDLECERHIERDELVRMLPTTAAMLSDDMLRYNFAKLGCSWFYRPQTQPSKLPCVSLCTTIRNFIRDLNVSTASPSQLKDRAVLQTIAWPVLLLSGQCEYTAFYDLSNDPAKCIHPEDYTHTFKTFDEAQLGRPTCKPYPEQGAVCSGLLTNVYHDPSEKPMTDLINIASPLIQTFYSMSPVLGAVNCVRSMAQYFCGKYMRSCTEIPVSLMDSESNTYAVKYAVPVLSHSSVCENYRKSCTHFVTSLSSLTAGSNSEVFQQVVQLLTAPHCRIKSPVGATYECNGKDYTSTYDAFPQSSYYNMAQASVQTHNFTFATQYDQSAIIPFYPEIQCPPPFVLPTSRDETLSAVIGGTSCSNPCPSVMFSKNDYHTSSLVFLIMSTISFACALFLVVSYIKFRELRKGTLFLPFLLSLCAITAALAIGTYARFGPNTSVQDTFCSSNTTPSTQTNNVGCTTQAFVLVFGFLALFAFYSCTALDTFLKLVLKMELTPNTTKDHLVYLGYLVWTWTIPLLLATLAAALNSLGPSPLGEPYCFITWKSTSNSTPYWGLFFIPIAIHFFVGGGLLATVLASLFKGAKLQQDEELRRHTGYKLNAGAPQRKIQLSGLITPFLLVIVFSLYILWVISYHIATFVRRETWNRAISNFSSCIIMHKQVQDFFSRLQNPENPVLQHCGPRPDTIQISAWWAHQIIFASLGILLFCVFGTQPLYYKLWGSVIGYYFNIPSFLVWAATTDQAKIYGRRIARERRKRAQKLREEGLVDEDVKSGAALVDKINAQDKLIKEKLRQEKEELQKKERDRQKQTQKQNLAMIAPHLRPLYMVQQRPRKELPSLAVLAQDPEAVIGPVPIDFPDIFVVFNVQSEMRRQFAGRNFDDDYDY